MGLDKVYLSWWDIEKAIHSLALAIRKSYFPDLIVGIARGGLIPAVSLSHTLGVEMAVVDVKFYRDVEGREREPIIRTSFPINPQGKRVLLVDDVSDTGETLKVVLRELHNSGVLETKVACLVVKPWTKVIPNFYVFRTDKWVVFPWEEFPVVVRE